MGIFLPLKEEVYLEGRADRVIIAAANFTILISKFNHQTTAIG